MSKKKEYARDEISLICVRRIKRAVVAEYGQEFADDFQKRITNWFVKEASGE